MKNPRWLIAFSLITFSLSLVLTSCDRAGNGDAVVSWPELVRLDESSYRAEGFVRVGDLEAVRGMLSELREAGEALTPETVPANVKDPQEVETIFADLVSLVEGLTAEGTDDETMSTIILGMHPVIEKLIGAAGMPHLHGNEGPNDGFLHPIFDGGGKQVGTAEIKLHDDAGDIEVWLTQGGHGGEPWLLPVETSLAMDFPAIEKQVTLAVRDNERNEDESGASTIIDGATAYFIFPGETGADASWLMGAEFAAKAELRFEEATTGSLILRPHVHRKEGE